MCVINDVRNQRIRALINYYWVKCQYQEKPTYVFDRKVPSGISMSFNIPDAFRQILILDKNSESHILDKKTGKSHLG